MSAGLIERDIHIEAPPEVVWRVVTDPGELQRWFCDALEIDPHPGGFGVITFTNRATTKPTKVRISVVSVEPMRLFSYRWNYPDGEEARPGNSTLVEFRLTPERGGTRLRVVESGLDLVAWSEAEKASFREGHIKGWEIHMANLRAFMLREQKAAAPR